jgi:hypothetical protein
MNRVYIALLLAAWPIAAQNPPDVCALPDYTTGDFDQTDSTCQCICPPEGTPGSDELLNRLKNRDILPDMDIEVITLRDMLDFVPKIASQQPPRLFRSRWPREAMDEVQPWECQPAIVEGYLVQRNVEGAETVNCGARSWPYVDFHIFLAESPDSPRGERVVVEMTPRVFATHPTWTPASILQLVLQNARVRVTGWRMWDPAHPDQLGITRGTLWEIHPIHKIEVLQDDGTWLEY